MTTNTILNTTSPSVLANALNFFSYNKLTPKDLDIKVNYLMHEFLVEQSLNMIFAAAGQGKSYCILAIAIKLLVEGKINKCIYLDMDNSTIALKTRGLDTLIDNNPNLEYLHHSKVENIADKLFTLADSIPVGEKALQSYMIVIDSIRDFLGGRDMNSDKELKPVLDKLKKLREAGATIVFLHHMPKDSTEVYKGSTSFNDSVDVSYRLTSEKPSKNILDYSLSVYKERIPVNHASFKLNTNTLELVSQNYVLNSLDQPQQKFIADVENILEDNIDGINQTNLLLALGKKKDDKTALKYLKTFDSQFWKSTRIPEIKNSLNYYPMPIEEVA